MSNQNEAVAVAIELVEASRATDMHKHLIDQFRQVIPDIPDSFWDSVDSGVLIDKLISIYIRHLTIENMKAAIAFFQSTAGQELLDKTPAISEESMKIGKQYGEELVRQWEENHDVE